MPRDFANRFVAQHERTCSVNEPRSATPQPLLARLNLPARIPRRISFRSVTRAALLMQCFARCRRSGGRQVHVVAVCGGAGADDAAGAAPQAAAAAAGQPLCDGVAAGGCASADGVQHATVPHGEPAARNPARLRPQMSPCLFRPPNRWTCYPASWVLPPALVKTLSRLLLPCPEEWL